MDEQSLDEEICESMLQLLELAEQRRGEGQPAEAERAYREVILTAEQEHLPDLAERGHRGLGELLSAQRLAQADAALRDHHLADAEAAYREVYEKLAPGDAAAASGLAQTSFLLGQQAEADERPMAAREYYAEALRIDPHFLQAQARLTAASTPQRKPLRVKILWTLIPAALVLLVMTVLWMRSWPGVERATSPTPTAPAIALSTMAPTSVPTAHASATPTEIVPPTVTSAPATVPSPAPSATAALPLTTDLVFVGRVQQPDGRPLVGFQYVQLWGANGPDLGNDLIHKVPSNSDGSFTLRTTDVYNYYFVSLDTAAPEAYEFVAAAPGPGGTWRGPREIRYENPASGAYDAILFIVRVVSPTATPTLTTTPTPTVTATPVLPAITLQEPPADFSGRGSAQFRWAVVDGLLPEGVFYELVMWAEDQKPYDARGVVGVTRDMRTDVNFEAVPHVRRGTYYWTVILVRTAPAYERLSQPTSGRRIYVEK